MGSDLTVVNAARVSFDKESTCETVSWYPADWEGEDRILSARDTKLINYLAKHNHFTPFTHPQITLRETVPIFVARQRFKHVVGFTYNEVSRRYVDDEPEFYIPEVWRKKAENKKQGSSDEPVEILRSRMHGDQTVADAYERLIYHAEELYQEMIAVGVAPEQARMVLPQSMLTSYYVTGSLAAFARAYKLRIDLHAQAEIQDLAKEWDRIIRPLFPVSWEALTN
jgi:thymidylate synthase (FAD)